MTPHDDQSGMRRNEHGEFTPEMSVVVPSRNLFVHVDAKAHAEHRLRCVVADVQLTHPWNCKCNHHIVQDALLIGIGMIFTL